MADALSDRWTVRATEVIGIGPAAVAEAGLLSGDDLGEVRGLPPLQEGFAYHMRSDLVVNAVDMAISLRRPLPGVIYHSDQASQYGARDFERRCRRAGITISMGSVGDCYDNLMAESFFATLECDSSTSTGFATPDFLSCRGRCHVLRCSSYRSLGQYRTGLMLSARTSSVLMVS